MLAKSSAYTAVSEPEFVMLTSTYKHSQLYIAQHPLQGLEIVAVELR